jgi:hypothetical protein
MKNIVILQKDEDGNIYCQQITQKGIDFINEENEDLGYWEEGGTILLSELEEILDREI